MEFFDEFLNNLFLCSMKVFRLPFLAKLALTLISIIGLGFLAKIGQPILVPLFFAFLLALLFVPFADFLESRLRLSRAISTVSSLVVMLLVASGIVYFFSFQLSDFINDIPTLEAQFTKTFLQLQTWILNQFDINFSVQMKYLNQGLEKLLSSSGLILGFTVNMFSSIFAFLAFSILFFIFILNYRRNFYIFITSVFADKHRLKVNEVIDSVQRVTKDYIVGLLIQILIVSVLTSVFLSVLGVKYAILLGVLTGLLNVIPYIGITIAALIACLISFATGGGNIFIIILGYVGIHFLDANITLPFVIGSKVKINAFFSFLALLIGEQLWGISGMFFGIPFLAILKIIFESVKELEPWGKVLGEEEDEESTEPLEKLKEEMPLDFDEK